MKHILLAISILVLTHCYGQDKNFFQFSQIHYNQIDSVEKDKNSVERFVSYKIGVSTDYFPNATSFDLAQPRIFDRPSKKDFIACQIDYYFTISDSIVRLISYTWDTKNSTTSLTDLMSETNDQSEKMEKYNSEFDILSGILAECLGNPISGSGNTVKKEEKGYPDWYERKFKWKKDKTNVELYMLWSDKGGVLGTYKIRTKIYWNE